MARNQKLLFDTQCAQQPLESLVLEDKLINIERPSFSIELTYFSQTGLHDLKLQNDSMHRKRVPDNNNKVSSFHHANHNYIGIKVQPP